MISTSKSSRIHRIKTLQSKLINQNIGIFLINHPDNIRYLTGFSGSSGWLLVSQKTVYLAVDFRYIQQARNATKNTGIIIINTKGDLETWLPEIVLDNHIKIIGFESNNLVYSIYRRLIDLLKTKDNQTNLLPCNNMVESLRAIKDDDEIGHITSAANLLDATFEFILTFLKPGITESQLAWMIERHLRENGNESNPFDIIVASGLNASMPHAKTTDKQIVENEPILLDFGAKIDGYCSDFSRTIFIGKIDDKFKMVYDIVLASQLTALASVTNGITGNEADYFARSVINNTSFKDNFGHGLGHGIGLSIHEYPRLGPNSNDIISNNMVFTIEPGIYIEGWGGVRLEDTVILKENKVISLNKARKLLHI